MSEILSEQEIGKIEHFQPTGWYPEIVYRLISTIRSLQAELQQRDAVIEAAERLAAEVWQATERHADNQLRAAVRTWERRPVASPSVAQRPAGNPNAIDELPLPGEYGEYHR